MHYACIAARRKQPSTVKDNNMRAGGICIYIQHFYNLHSVANYVAYIKKNSLFMCVCVCVCVKSVDRSALKGALVTHCVRGQVFGKGGEGRGVFQTTVDVCRDDTFINRIKRMFFSEA